jgi:ABC-2 type transport system ATP-binding protein
LAEAPAALDIQGLAKAYPVGHLLWRHRRPALRGLDLLVRPGEVFGYLGPNGSGKTTTLKLLMGLLHPDAGSIRVLGLPHEARAWRQRVGYLPEHPYLYDYLSAGEYLDYAGRLFGLPPSLRRDRARALLQQVGLSGAEGLPLRRFSKGMTQRAGLAQALVNDPEMVFLDEPMSGLDPIGRRLVRNLMLDLRARGKTVFFSTHILPDAETLCDRVAVLDRGRLLQVGRLDEILRVDVAHMEALVTGVGPEAVSSLAGVKAVPVGERLRLELDEGSLGDVIQAVERAGGRVLAVQPVRQSLEDYFFRELGARQDVSRGLLD